MDIRFNKEYESNTAGENQQRIPTKERRRYIIHYRQNVNNILEKEETPEIPVTGYIIGDYPKQRDNRYQASG
jgi:hypothetical protein